MLECLQTLRQPTDNRLSEKPAHFSTSHRPNTIWKGSSDSVGAATASLSRPSLGERALRSAGDLWSGMMS